MTGVQTWALPISGVIKVEPPGAGDDVRSLGPFPEGTPDPNSGGIFIYLNTNKRGITLNLETATGRDLLLELVSSTDDVVEPFASGTLDRLGFQFGPAPTSESRQLSAVAAPYNKKLFLVKKYLCFNFLLFKI